MRLLATPIQDVCGVRLSASVEGEEVTIRTASNMEPLDTFTWDEYTEIIDAGTRHGRILTINW